MSEQTIRVLLLDDEESLRTPLAEYLRNTHGLIVDAVADGNAALRLVEEAQGRYDVVLIDEVLLEPPSGLEVVKEIKTRYPDIEVILFTGWGMQAGIEALRAGAYRYFAKPFDKDELAMTIRFAAEYGQTRRERKILAAFQQVATAISSTLDRNEILGRACQAAVELFDVDHSGLVEFTEDYEFGKVVAEFPEKGTLGTVIQVRGVPPEEKLVHQQEVLNIPDVDAEHSLGSVRDTLLGFGIQSILIVPVVLQGRVVASFSLDVIDSKRVFYPSEIELCKSLANQVAVAINNARLYEETREGRDYLHSLYQATIEVISPRTPKDVLQNIVETACRTTGAWRAVALLVSESERPRVLASYGFEGEVEATSIRRERGISNTVLKSGQPRFIPDTAAESDQVNPAMLEQGVKAAACLPLPLAGKNIGVLWIHFREKHTFSETEQQALQLYANQSAIAYDNARRMRELERLRTAAEAMASKQEWKDVLQEIAKSAKQVLEADYTLIWHYDAERKIFFPEDLVAEGIPDDLLEEFRKEEPHPGSTTEHILREGYAVVEDVDGPQAEFVGQPTRVFLKKLGVKSFQGICLKVADESLGVLFVDYKHVRGFGEEDSRILEHFANHAALTLKRARLHEQIRRARITAQAIARASVLGNLDQILDTTVSGARDVLRCDIATVYTFDEDKQQFVRYAGVGYRDARNMRPPAKVDPRSSLWRIIRLAGEKSYHLSENAINDDLLKGWFVQAEGVQSALGIQLRLGDHRVGVMFINYRTPHRFTQEEIDDALLFANQAAAAIHNAQLHDEVRRRANVMAGLYEAGKTITSTLSLEETLNHIAEQVLYVVGAGSMQGQCFAHIAMREGNKLRFVAAYPRTMLAPIQQQIEIDLTLKGEQKIGIAGRCVNERKPQKVDDVSKDRDYIQAVERTKSQLSVPLKVGDDVIGVVSVEHPELSAFTDECVRNLELLAAQAVMAIQNARRFEELQKTKEMLAARTALAWTGMIGSTWRHAVEKHALTIREQIQLLRSDLASKARVDTTNKRLEMIERLANQILEKPLTPPLSAEEGVISLPINDLLRERVKQLWVHEPYKSVLLELQLRLDNTATVRASPEWLRRALDILIDNAVEATTGLSERKIVIGSQQRDHCADIFITDNGRGMQPEVLERLFREPIKKPQGAKGQGIGLLLAQMIVQTYGGTIYCRETGPTGTTMVISLPLEK